MKNKNKPNEKNQQCKTQEDGLLERVIEWRKLFNEANLKRGQAIADVGQYENLIFAGDHAHAKIGEYRQAFRVQIYGAPKAYTDEWNLDEFHCTCNTGRKKMYSWYSPQERTCAHEAALLFLWEKKHGVWKFRETEEERAESLAAERIEAEEVRRKELKKRKETRRKQLLNFIKGDRIQRSPAFLM